MYLGPLVLISRKRLIFLQKGLHIFIFLDYLYWVSADFCFYLFYYHISNILFQKFYLLYINVIPLFP